MGNKSEVIKSVVRPLLPTIIVASTALMGSVGCSEVPPSSPIEWQKTKPYPLESLRPSEVGLRLALQGWMKENNLTWGEQVKLRRDLLDIMGRVVAMEGVPGYTKPDLAAPPVLEPLKKDQEIPFSPWVIETPDGLWLARQLRGDGAGAPVLWALYPIKVGEKIKIEMVPRKKPGEN